MNFKQTWRLKLESWNLCYRVLVYEMTILLLKSPNIVWPISFKQIMAILNKLNRIPSIYKRDLITEIADQK